MEQEMTHVPFHSKNLCLGSYDGAKWSFGILSETSFHDKKALDFISSKSDTDLCYCKQVTSVTIAMSISWRMLMTSNVYRNIQSQLCTEPFEG